MLARAPPSRRPPPRRWRQRNTSVRARAVHAGHPHVVKALHPVAGELGHAARFFRHRDIRRAPVTTTMRPTGSRCSCISPPAALPCGRRLPEKPCGLPRTTSGKPGWRMLPLCLSSRASAMGGSSQLFDLAIDHFRAGPCATPGDDPGERNRDRIWVPSRYGKPPRPRRYPPASPPSSNSANSSLRISPPDGVRHLTFLLLIFYPQG